MVGFVWFMAMGDKWSGTSLSMAYILDQIWELGNLPENPTSKSNEMKCHRRRLIMFCNTFDTDLTRHFE